MMAEEPPKLPPPNMKRWTAHRKAAVAGAVRDGWLTLEGACERYKLSAEELIAWMQVLDQHGLYGLRLKRLQEYRKTR